MPATDVGKWRRLLGLGHEPTASAANLKGPSCENTSVPCHQQRSPTRHRTAPLPMVDARLAARPPRPRAPVRLPFAASTATRRAGWRCPRDPRVDSSGGGTFPFPSPGRCPRLAVAHRNRSPAANLGLPPPRPLLPTLPAAGIRTRVTGDGGCEGRPLVECTGDRSVEEQPEHAGG